MRDLQSFIWLIRGTLFSEEIARRGEVTMMWAYVTVVTLPEKKIDYSGIRGAACGGVRGAGEVSFR